MAATKWEVVARSGELDLVAREGWKTARIHNTMTDQWSPEQGTQVFFKWGYWTELPTPEPSPGPPENMTEYGTKASGNWGHAGRPGERGGSAPSSEAPSYTSDSSFSTAAGSGRIASEGPLKGGICDSRKVEYKDDGAGVWKETRPPLYGEDGRRNNHDGESEVAAYALSEALGFHVVPETVFATSEDGLAGTSQRFVDDSIMGYKVYVGTASEADQDRLETMFVLDAIIGNGDRHSGNWLRGGDGVIYAIDHGHSYWTSWEKSGDYVINGHGGHPFAHSERWQEQWQSDMYRPSESIMIGLRSFTRGDFDKAMDSVQGDYRVNKEQAWANIQRFVSEGGIRKYP